MKRMKSIISIVLILIFTLLTGCRSSISTTKEANKQTSVEEVAQPPEKMEISIALWELAQTISKDDPLFRQVENKFNIKISPVSIGNEYMQTYQIWAASGQLPDVFAVDAISSKYYRNWVSNGIIKAIPENLSAYPNLSEYLSAPEFQYLKENGKLYCIPRKTYDSTAYNVLDRVVAYRWDLAQQAGIKNEPETFEDFRNMLQAIVKLDPENKKIEGLTCVSNLLIGGLFWLYGSPAATSDGSGSDFKWIKEDGRFIPAFFSKNSIESLKMLRSFYTSGLIDKDILATRGEMAFDKFAQGKAAAFITSSGVNAVDSSIYRDRWLKTNPGEKEFYNKVKLLKPLKSFDGSRYHAVFKSYWSESYISSRVNDDKMDRILKLFNYLGTPEYLEMRRYGIKDIDYKKDGTKLIPINPKQDIETKYKLTAILSTLLSWDGMFKLDSDYLGISPEGQAAQKELLEYSKKMTSEQNYDIRLSYMSTQTKDSFTIFDSEDMFRVMISKQPVEVVWQEVVNGYKAKGLDKMIEEVNIKANEMGIN